ncbi:hypothetical protein M3197_14550 [Sporosarcina aquimarina]|uniref:hypothetical protein n=1 Tax=Sporosarcina aquimarina TaxID=114975 RepID=UPI00203CF266|nr:hypothetical protein [Sporosarcina aquimarina]MCM3758682.1 hypothetical protein [Sporosarcina aquimarina]
MKRLLILAMVALLLAACSDTEQKKEETRKVETQGPSSVDKTEKSEVEKKDDVSREFKNALKSAQN